MPIIIPREGQLPNIQSPLSQEQRDMLWEQIIRNWARNNPNKLREMLDDFDEEEQVSLL